MSSCSLCRRTLRRLLLCVLFREMVTDNTSAYRADHRVMTGHTTDDSALKAAGGVCRSDACKKECCCDQPEFVSSFYVVCTRVLGAKVFFEASSRAMHWAIPLRANLPSANGVEPGKPFTLAVAPVSRMEPCRRASIRTAAYSVRLRALAMSCSSIRMVAQPVSIGSNAFLQRDGGHVTQDFPSTRLVKRCVLVQYIDGAGSNFNLRIWELLIHKRRDFSVGPLVIRSYVEHAVFRNVGFKRENARTRDVADVHILEAVFPT